MNGGHTPDGRRDHRFTSLRGCACARREAVPERPHLSGLQRGERCPDLPGGEAGAAAAISCRPHGATGYLAAEPPVWRPAAAPSPPPPPQRPVFQFGPLLSLCGEAPSPRVHVCLWVLFLREHVSAQPRCYSQ
jgi:hypothetical protein